MSRSAAISQCGRRSQVAPPTGASAPTSPSRGWSTRQELAPRPDGDVGLLAADGDVRVGRVRDPQEQLLELGLDGRELRVDRVDLRRPASTDAAFSVGDLGAVRRRAALDRLADLLARRVALGLERVALAEQRPPAGVELERRGRRSTGPRPCRWRPAGPSRRLRAAAAARRSCRHLPASRDARRRSMTNVRVEATRAASRPAGPFGRPRNAA